MNGNENISSKAVLKYEQIPLVDYIQLEKHTDLNLPPVNWLNDIPSGCFANFTRRQHEGFDYSSLLMADKYPECLGEVDVISSAEHIKKLLKIPFSSAQVSLSVHKIGKSIMLNNFDIPTLLYSQVDSENYQQLKWLHDFYTSVTKDKNFFPKKRSKAQSELEMMLSKFMYHSIDNKAFSEESENPAKVSSFSEEKPARLTSFDETLLHQQASETPLHPVQSSFTSSSSVTPSFQRDLIWNFEDITMLLGSDLPIFGRGKYPAVSLRLRECSKPINVLTGIDYWLDNLMCNVPELIMCYHDKGIVKQYEKIKTADLPNMEGSQFSPKVICDIAQNILSFLNSNCTKEGHTYWLYKSSKDDVVKLYDLTSIALETQGQKDPFRVSVAVLLYKIAHNMHNSGELNQRNSSKVIEMLEICVRLLKDETKQIALLISASHLLSQLYTTNFDNNNDTFDFDIDSTSTSDDESETGEKYPLTPIPTMEVKAIYSPFRLKETPQSPTGILTLEAKCKKAVGHAARTLNLLSDKKSSPFENEKPKKSNNDLRISKPKDDNFFSVSAHEILHSSCVNLTDISISKKKLGNALRYVQFSLSCLQNLIDQVLNRIKTLTFYADILTMLVHRDVNVAAEKEQFLAMSENNANVYKILKPAGTFDSIDIARIENCFEESHENLLKQSLKVYEQALSLTDTLSEPNLKSRQIIELSRRLGNVRNELGSFYMNRAASLTKLFGLPSDVETTLWKESFTYLQRSIESFDVVEDKSNTSLVYSNMGKLMHLCTKVYGNSSKTDVDSPRCQFTQQEKTCFAKAFEYYNKALSVADDKTIKQHISLEVSKCYFQMACLMQDYAPLKSTSEETVMKDVSSTLMKALHHCEWMLNENNYSISSQVASIHQRLASLYHHQLRNQISESGKKNYRSLADLHYRKVYDYYTPHRSPIQLLNTMIEHVALHDYIAQQHQNNNKMLKVKLELVVARLPTLILCLQSSALTKDEELYKMLVLIHSQISSAFKDVLLKAKKAKQQNDFENVAVLKSYYEVTLRNPLKEKTVDLVLDEMIVIVSRLNEVKSKN